MLPFRRIVFPVDYSEPCLAVVPHVKEMVRHFNAELSVLHGYWLGALAGELVATSPQWPEEMRIFEERRLQQFASEMFPSQHVESFVEQGEAGSIIHRFVQRQGSDLVMIPTRGQGPVRRFLLGSVAAKVLHDVSAAVWTSTGLALTEHQPGIPYKRIVCALDQSEETEAVLRAPAALACSYRAELFLLRTVEMPPVTSDTDLSPYRKQLMDAADFGLRDLKEKLGVTAPHRVTNFMVADAIRDEVVRRKADLIVAGRGKSQGPVSRLWSVLYSIVRESPCPVLSV